MEFLEFMAEKRTVDRWFVLKIALIGAVAGGLLTIAFSLTGLVA